jgi:hypothetical protein
VITYDKEPVYHKSRTEEANHRSLGFMEQLTGRVENVGVFIVIFLRAGRTIPYAHEGPVPSSIYRGRLSPGSRWRLHSAHRDSKYDELRTPYPGAI